MPKPPSADGSAGPSKGCSYPAVEETAVQLKRNYFAVLIMSQKTWVPAQIVNFELVPQDFQVLFVNLISVFWNTYLSMAN